MAYANIASQFMPTPEGEFIRYGLTEVCPVGHDESGRLVVTALNHYVMKPIAFDPSEPTTIHIRPKRNPRDLLFPISTGNVTPSRHVLTRLGQGENGILLYVDTLPSSAISELQQGLARTVPYQPNNLDSVVGAFRTHLQMPTDTDTFFTRAYAMPLPSRLGPLEIEEGNEVVRDVLVPPFIQERLFGQQKLYGINHHNMRIDVHLGHFACFNLKDGNPPIVGVDSTCAGGQFDESDLCDCVDQSRIRMQETLMNGGVLLSHEAEGRGIHLESIKIILKGDPELKGLRSHAAMLKAGFPENPFRKGTSDLRDYFAALALLKRHKINAIHVRSNNPSKIAGIKMAGEKLGIEILGNVPVQFRGLITTQKMNYAASKVEDAGHDKAALVCDRGEPELHSDALKKIVGDVDFREEQECGIISRDGRLTIEHNTFALPGAFLDRAMVTGRRNAPDFTVVRP